eukprot:GHVU01134148.1.p1 GENE.GHVU01134148.1~~GHVU01134148.1.p1  ORF type:complete len:361 (+),score=91.27 GHVU01134148.1:249-1331(+)
MSSRHRKTCYYEVLEVERLASDDEIKKQYRKLALKWHPDKNADNQDEAKTVFQRIQEAYEVLSDPQERCWYDGHREQVLAGKGNDYGPGEDSFSQLNLFEFFGRDCFSGFGDDEGGFYAVYREVFKNIMKEEEINLDPDIKNGLYGMPEFGDSATSRKNVIDLYAKWSSFYSVKRFGHADVYKTKDGPSRWVRRRMEEENKKGRREARREFSENVQALVRVVRRRDPRVAQINMEDMMEKQQQADNARLQVLQAKEERKAAHQLAKEAEKERWEEMRREKESAIASGQTFVADDSDEEDEAAGPGSDSDESEDEVSYYCDACKKHYKSLEMKVDHERSKKHKKNVQAMMTKNKGGSKGHQ